MSINSRLFHDPPLGMNFRNRLIKEANPGAALRLARDKSSFKRLITSYGLPTSKTYLEIHDFRDLRLVPTFPSQFVIKPADGHGGDGILVLERKGTDFVDPSGQIYTAKTIKRHLRRILDGEFSDSQCIHIAMIEERLYPSEELRFRDVVGLPDIRIFCYDFRPVMAMLRYPTKFSKGRANLAKGAYGISIELDTGMFRHVRSKQRNRPYCLADLGIPEEFSIPRWSEMLDIAAEASCLSMLRMSGVDLVLDHHDEVRILEINGRPGLEIQNINAKSLIGVMTSPVIFERPVASEPPVAEEEPDFVEDWGSHDFVPLWHDVDCDTVETPHYEGLGRKRIRVSGQTPLDDTGVEDVGLEEWDEEMALHHRTPPFVKRL